MGLEKNEWANVYWLDEWVGRYWMERRILGSRDGWRYPQMNRETDGWMDGRFNTEWMDSYWIGGKTGGTSGGKRDGKMDEWWGRGMVEMGGKIKRWMCAWETDGEGCISGWTDAGLLEEWIRGQIDGWMDGCSSKGEMNGRM